VDRRTLGRSNEARRIAEAFGQQVAKRREAKGWSQGDLATRAGLSQAAISHVEAGTRTPSIATAQAVAAALDVSVGTLMGEQWAAVVGDEARFLAEWRAAPPRVQHEVVRYLRYLRSTDEPNKAPGGPRGTR
jgi:transcriptional regulator with XRE-family HTH domain